MVFSIFTSALSFLAALVFSFQGFKKGFGLLVIFLIFNGIEEAATTILALNGIINWWLVYILFPVHFWFTAYLLRLLEPDHRKEIKIITSVVLIQIMILHTIYFFNHEFGTIGLLLGALALSVIAGRVLISAPYIPKPWRLFAIATFVYYSFSATSFLALNSFHQLYPIPFFINSAANSIQNLIFAWGVWKLRAI